MIKAIVVAGAVAVSFPLLIILLVTASSGTPAQATSSATGLAGEPTALAYLSWR